MFLRKIEIRNNFYSHEDKIYELQYNASSQVLRQLKGVSWTAPAEIMRRISSVLVVGTYGSDSSKII
jgi:hypothetical protein